MFIFYGTVFGSLGLFAVTLAQVEGGALAAWALG